MKIKEFIRQRRIDLGLSMEDVAIACGVAKATVSRWESGDIENIKSNKIKSLAKVLQIKPSVLIDDDLDDNYFYEEKTSNLSAPRDVSFITIPLYGDISCGNGMFVDDNIIDTIEVVANGLTGDASDYFAQVASGDSMINAGIEDGDLLIFKKSSVIDNGQIGSFCIDDSIATCKKFKEGETFIQLIPMNPSYDPIVIDLNNANFRVVGILKRAIKEFE